MMMIRCMDTPTQRIYFIFSTLQIIVSTQIPPAIDQFRTDQSISYSPLIDTYPNGWKILLSEHHTTTIKIQVVSNHVIKSEKLHIAICLVISSLRHLYSSCCYCLGTVRAGPSFLSAFPSHAMIIQFYLSFEANEVHFRKFIHILPLPACSE